jgi:hypothetical protein
VYGLFLVGLIFAQHSKKGVEQASLVVKDSMAVGDHPERAFIDRRCLEPFTCCDAKLDLNTILVTDATGMNLSIVFQVNRLNASEPFEPFVCL